MHTIRIYRTTLLPLLASLCLLCGCSDESAEQGINLPEGGLKLTLGNIYVENSSTKADTRSSTFTQISTKGAILNGYLYCTFYGEYVPEREGLYVFGDGTWQDVSPNYPIMWMGPRENQGFYLSYPYDEATYTSFPTRTILPYSEANDHWIGRVDLNTTQAIKDLITNEGRINEINLSHTLARCQIQIAFDPSYQGKGEVSAFKWQTKADYEYTPTTTAPYGMWKVKESSTSREEEIAEYQQHPLVLKPNDATEVANLVYPPEAMAASTDLSFKLTIDGLTYDLTNRIYANAPKTAGMYKILMFTLSDKALELSYVFISGWENKGDQSSPSMDPVWPTD